MPKDYTRDVVRRPRPVAGTAAVMAEAQGTSFWVGGGTPMPIFNAQNNTIHGKLLPGGAANRIPPEIALKISEYLNVKDLARTAMAWRPVAMASYASPEFVKLECARFSLLTNHSLTWRPDMMRHVRDRMEQYNFAWATLQYSGSQSFDIPQTTQDTPWAGSNNWRSGNRFTGESNGYVYDVGSWEAGPRIQARICLYQLPSLRTGEIDVKRRQFDIALNSHFVKAVCVDPVGQVIAILEYNNNESPNPCSRIPFLHVYHLKNGHHIKTVMMRVGFDLLSEVYHMEVHGEMVCVVADVAGSPNNYPESDVRVQNWTGADRCVSISRPYDARPYCTGFQFITDDLFIMTEKSRLDPRDTVQSCVIRVGHIRLNTQQIINLRDVHGKGWTPNKISVIRNVSNYQPVSGAFSANPSNRLFGLKYDYRGFDGVWKSNACLFGQTTVESWLSINTLSPVEPQHWLVMPMVNYVDPRPDVLRQSNHYDPSNREGCALIGRRLFWGEVWPSGWGLNVLDYNPGAGTAIQANDKETRGKLWQSYTCHFDSDPYPVSYTATTRISDVSRIIPTEDGLLVKQNGYGASGFLVLMM
ncbi:hypothetical protein C8R44DRAFT_391178 [Mycena epipterygia]|nr:hypothetical protein C8R44DRAFT_391178 [Mycena epipterygia]